MHFLAAVLIVSIDVDLDLAPFLKRHERSLRTVTCGTMTVGYRFRGRPGQVFRYAGDTYAIPMEGWIELIADRRRTTYAIGGKSLPLGVWPRDAFGFRDVTLPSAGETR
jgi:hypothetical protein